MRLAHGLGRSDNRQHALVLGRNDLHKVLAHRLEAVEQLNAARALRRVHVLLDERANLRQLASRRGLEFHALVVHTGLERAVLVKDIGHATRHTGGEVLPDLAQDERQAARHVLAAMVAAALDHHGGTGVTHAKALACQAVNKAAAARGAKERHVAHDDVLVELVGRMRVGAHRHLAARKALAKVVVGVAAHVERNAARQKGAKALTGRTIAIDGDGAGGQALGMRLGHRIAQDGAHATVDVGDIGAEPNRAQVRTGIGRIGHKQRGVERLVELAVRSHLRQEVATVGARDMGTELAGRARQHGRQIKQVGLAVARYLDLAQALGMADHLVDGAEAQARHDLTQLLGNKEHKVLNVLGLAAEAATQATVLRGDAGRAGILLAVALHEAAHGDERHGRKAKLLGAQQAGDGNIGAVHELAVGLEHHAGAQAVLQQRLLSLGKAELQRQAGVPNGIARRGTRAAIVAADQDLVGGTLGHTGGDGADAGLADQLDRHARTGVGVLKIKDQLCQVLDGVDVVVRRRRDQADAGRGLTDLGDPGVDLLTGQVATLAGLGALGHLDLNLEGAAQVAARYAKARTCHLLDGGVLGVTVSQRGLATRILAALARVRASMQAVHGDGHALVRLFADRTVRHGTGVKAADDVARGLHLVERNRRAAVGIKVEQVTQAHGTAGAVQAGAVLLKGVVAVLTAGGLQQVDSLRIDEVILAAERAPLGQTQRGQLIGSRALKDSERGVVALVLLALNVLDTHTAHTAHRAGEVRVDELRRKAHGLEDLRRMVALHRGDAHLGHNGNDAGGRSLIVVGDALLGCHVQIAVRRQVANARMRVVRIDAARGVAHQRRKVVRRHGVATLHHDVGKGTHAGADQVVVHAAHGEQ